MRQKEHNLFEKAKCLFFFHYCCLYWNRGNDKTRHHNWAVDSNGLQQAHFSKRKQKYRAKPNQVIFCFCGYCFWVLFSNFFFFTIYEYVHTYLYTIIFLSLFVILVLYMNTLDEFSLWRTFLRRYSEGKKGNQNWLGLPYQLLSWGFFGHFGSLWMSVIINPEDCCYVAVTSSVSVIRELALFYLALIAVNICCYCGK